MHCDCCLPEDGEEPMAFVPVVNGGFTKVAKPYQTLYSVVVLNRIGSVAIVLIDLTLLKSQLDLKFVNQLCMSCMIIF